MIVFKTDNWITGYRLTSLLI